MFDILDGRVARMLNIASKFGAELDSLSDAISFGVAPGFMIYQWTLRDAGGLGWIAVLVFAVCSALRLARFNTMLEDTVPYWAKSYFTGVPAPAGAGLALLPLMAFLEFGDALMMPPSGYRRMADRERRVDGQPLADFVAQGLARGACVGCADFRGGRRFRRGAHHQSVAEPDGYRPIICSEFAVRLA